MTELFYYSVTVEFVVFENTDVSDFPKTRSRTRCSRHNFFWRPHPIVVAESVVNVLPVFFLLSTTAEVETDFGSL